MCLAVPAKVIELSDTTGVADLHGNKVQVSTLLVPETKVGDWVLVHAGFAIQRLEPEAAQATFAVLADLHKSTAPP